MKNKDDFKVSRIIMIVICAILMALTLASVPLITIFEIAKGQIAVGVVKIICCVLVFIVSSIVLGITISWIRGKKMIDKMLQGENKNEPK